MARMFCRSIAVFAVFSVENGGWLEVNKNSSEWVVWGLIDVEYVEMVQKSNRKWAELAGVQVGRGWFQEGTDFLS